MEYPDLATWPVDLQDAVAKRGSLNVYRMVAHSPGLAPGFLALADAVLLTNSLPAQWRELAIVRVGHVYGAAYEIQSDV
jgi:4-carboxymuconolactone decarboxylase